jgi:hypothetical protein
VVEACFLLTLPISFAWRESGQRAHRYILQFWPAPQLLYDLVIEMMDASTFKLLNELGIHKRRDAARSPRPFFKHIQIAIYFLGPAWLWSGVADALGASMCGATFTGPWPCCIWFA